MPASSGQGQASSVVNSNRQVPAAAGAPPRSGSALTAASSHISTGDSASNLLCGILGEQNFLSVSSQVQQNVLSSPSVASNIKCSCFLFSKITLKELQSLIGSLFFVCKAISPYLHVGPSFLG